MIGPISDPVTIIIAVVSHGYLEMSGSTFPGILTNWVITIQMPASAVIDSAPATTAHQNTRAGMGRARRWRRRNSAVLRGHHLPPSHNHANHTSIAIAGTDHGSLGLVPRLTTISADQTPCGTSAIT